MAAIKTPVKLASGPQHSVIKEHFTGHVTLLQHKMIPVSDTHSSQRHMMMMMIKMVIKNAKFLQIID